MSDKGPASFTLYYRSPHILAGGGPRDTDREVTGERRETEAERYGLRGPPPFPTIHLPTVTGSLRGFMMGWEGVRR